jgi:hypothetical protein
MPPPWLNFGNNKNNGSEWLPPINATAVQRFPHGTFIG